jgi:ATP adenylyltransferase
MDKQRIWAPWRIGYIAPEGEVPGQENGGQSRQNIIEPTCWHEGADQNCFLCRSGAVYASESEADRRNLVVWRGQHMIGLLNRYPYTNGHLLISPLRHVAELNALSDQEHLQGMRLLGRMTELLKDLFQADGFNIGLNLGSPAGAGVPGHLHWHLVPRWRGDHNFMPTIAGIRVIPQSLDAAWETIHGALEP